jgi:spore coat protein U-like protein
MMHPLKRLACIALFCIGTGLSPLPAHAVLINCTIATTGITFTNYVSPGNVDDDGSGNVAVTCNAIIIVGLASYTIALSAGNGSFPNRKLKSGAHTLNYNMYVDAARLTVWGDGSSGTQTVADSYIVLLTPTLRNYPVYGRIPGGQNQPAGTYQDTVTATVTF